MQELNENTLELVSGGYAIPTPARLSLRLNLTLSDLIRGGSWRLP